MKAIGIFVTFFILFSNNISAQKSINSSCFQIISGTVKNTNTNKLVKNALVELYKGNTIVKSLLSSNKGGFNIKVPCDNSYHLVASKDNFSKTKKKFVTSNVSNIKVEFTLYIKPKKGGCFQIVNGRITDEFYNNPIENVTVEIRNKKLIKTDISNTNGNYHFKLPCNSTYTLLFSKENYIATTTNTKLNKTNKKVQRKDIVLHLKQVKQKETQIKPIEQKVVQKQITKIPLNIEIPAILFKLNSSNIDSYIANSLNKIVQLMNLKPSVTVELNSHTDSRGPTLYNLNLSEARVQAMISYLIANGIDATRITGKGYGDTKLLNDCTKEKHCSENEHRKNKRIEIIIRNNESIEKNHHF